MREKWLTRIISDMLRSEWVLGRYLAGSVIVVLTGSFMRLSLGAGRSKTTLPQMGLWKGDHSQVGILLSALLGFAMVLMPVHAAEPMTHLPAGTTVESRDSAHWNHVIMTAQPVFSSGDVSKIPASIQESACRFILTLMASIEELKDSDTGDSKFQLRDVGIGYAIQDGHELEIITPETVANAKRYVSFFQKQILLENERQIKKVNVVARTSTLLIFDAPAVVLLDGHHKSCWMRHLLWIDSGSGTPGLLAWLLAGEPRTDKAVIGENVRWIKNELQEQRRIHVDGNEIIVGIPGELAFALEGLPPGRDLRWEESARAIAGKVAYSREDLTAFTRSLTQMLRQPTDERSIP